ncbi:MAG: hypothetical protein ABI822_31275 [Bryobacteraceae bacterium]
MAQTGSLSTRELARILKGEAGISFSIAQISERENFALPLIDDGQIVTRNVAAELAEKTASVKYPLLHVYCDKVVNSLREKFRTFSGTANMNVEIRVSHDHIEELETRLQLYVDAVTEVLDRNRGEWTRGMYYSGGYGVQFGAVKKGGKHFLQIAKVQFELNISSE